MYVAGAWWEPMALALIMYTDFNYVWFVFAKGRIQIQIRLLADIGRRDDKRKTC